MEIEFNPGRPTQPGTSQPVTRRAAAEPATEAAQIEGTRSLERQLTELPRTRPEQVDRARTLVQDVKYPPVETMNRIANLLAIHMRNR